MLKTKRRKWWPAAILMSLFLSMSIGIAFAADYRPLVGRWQRTDGGYVIDIRRVGSDGAMEANYYNPRPINVANAAASVYKDHLKVDLELRDIGYPGSTYTLLYDPEKDLLLGYYFQAVQRQNFDVVFVRLNR